jgi:UDP-2,4-diacetamido-2,4,6-trideoxy-beta-L-altropyranose hydrolase
MKSEREVLLIRADADQEIGTGHVMRCLALVQAWQENGGEPATFVMARKTPALESRLVSEGQQVLDISASPGGADDARQTIAAARRKKAACIVVDGYRFGAEYQRIIKGAGLRLLFVDDFGHAGHYCADLVLNQNLCADEALYSDREPYTCLLLGSRYVLLRREFRPLRGRLRTINAVGSKVLVTLGGTDPANATLKVIKAVQQARMESLEAVVVIGGSNRHYEELRSALRDSPPAIRLEHDATNMPELMAWADLAVSAGGSTSWEIAFAGLPNLVMALDERQLLVARELHAKGVAQNLGLYEGVSVPGMGDHIKRLLLSSEDRSLMSVRGQSLIDGRGAERVVGALTRPRLRLRPVGEGDCEQLWKWVNDPDVRTSAFRSDVISWDEHRQWFSEKLNNPTCFQFIALDDRDVSVGQIRFDVRDGEAQVDVSIDKDKRGLGYGAALIQIGVRELARMVPVKAVHAFIKPENDASRRAFQKAAFRDQGVTDVKGCPSIHLMAEAETPAQAGGARAV